MIHRVSPEGRAQALKEQRRRQRAQARVIGWMVVAAILIVAGVLAINAWAMPVGNLGVIAAIVASASACVAIMAASRPRAVPAASLTQVDLPRLADRTATWLEQQRPALPAPAAALLDGIGTRLEAMAPQLAGVDARVPAADAVRRLLGTELPALVSGYQGVPLTLRAQGWEGGLSADTQLLEGLATIDGEIARMTEQLARGAFDELAIQNRFLALKYREDGGLGI